MMGGQTIIDPAGEIKIGFGYHYNNSTDDSSEESDGTDIRPGNKLRRANSSFSCLSGAALSANTTLANTNICNGLFGAEILPALDSPTSFRRIPSSPSFSKLDLLSSSLQSSGAAGEDRIQAVCSEENDSLFCAIYDGFNGRDAADFLAGMLYETIRHYLGLLDWDGLPYLEVEKSCTTFKQRVLNSLEQAIIQAENDFLHMVEQEMDNRPDLVSIGSCVLVVILLGKNMYVLNAGDSRAVLATYGDQGFGTNSDGQLQAVQLTKSMNDALMGILRVRNTISPPYISVQPSLTVHEISSSDHFVVLGIEN
ncbi:hypothetical protein K7X08_022298 [Anisodus acutangulus]|uniref:PPM-type phosphatase domain-containing protein n=1 Tax=Anisodus acutangulus TaxID=402998 RepID=A0A9Q1MHP7_9SOLA|nr:hypothetical protein K7X08_022298 [Anisodus acutangulus]